jgi:nucleotide-binding universal stress UspA family protein
MFRKILVGFDGSKESMKALEVAINLAKASNGKIKVVEVIRHEPAIETYVKENIRDKEKIIKHREMVIKLSQENGIEIDYHATYGDPSLVLSKIAEMEDFDLIIVGKRKIRGIRKVFTESVSVNLVKNTNRPVLVII